MTTFTKNELEDAHRAITSLLSKCEKVQPKLLEGTAQRTLIDNRIKALRIAATLIADARNK